MFNIDFTNSFRSPSSDKVAYFTTDRDEDNDTRYYGFQSSKGTWYIIRDIVSSGQTRYFTGKTDYPTNWAGRAALSYNYIPEVS